MAITVDTPRTWGVTGEDRRANELPVLAAEDIPEGAAVGDNAAGFMRNLIAADVFRGFAFRRADNSAAGAADGDISVRLREKGEVTLAVVGVVDEDDVGETVFASDNGTFTLTAGGNTAIGKITRHETGTTAVVEFASQQLQSL